MEKAEKYKHSRTVDQIVSKIAYFRGFGYGTQGTKSAVDDILQDFLESKDNGLFDVCTKLIAAIENFDDFQAEIEQIQAIVKKG